MSNKLRHLYWLSRYLGLRWLFYRGAYAIRQRSGYLERRLPICAWDDLPLATFLKSPALSDGQALLAARSCQDLPFFFDAISRTAAERLFAEWDRNRSPVIEAQELLNGNLRFFNGDLVKVGSPPDWFRNAITGAEMPANRHWSRIDEFAGDDIKVVWEPSRFAFAYTLVRAYWRTGNECWPELFWRWVEDWRHFNPPQQGPNWRCGQETSLRVMAWCFALHGFARSRASTAQRVAMLTQMIAVSGHRIQANLGYALSQRNNHAISEGVGLWTIGLLFPELQQSDRWRERGRRIVEHTASNLIYEDGAFSQHSLNYHRLMLHDYLWALRLGELHGQPFESTVYDRAASAAEFLYQLQDTRTGSAPAYGAIDGALILPLDNCEFSDYRPVVQALTYLTTHTRRFSAGPWDEGLLWFFGDGALQAQLQPVRQTDFCAEVGGYYTLRSEEGFAFTRCARFQDRPGQADLLHVDIWWRGHNVAVDPGTYSYNAATSWLRSFDGTTAHNTVSVDGLDQMERVGRFLWLPWPKGVVRCRLRSPNRAVGYWEGEQTGYLRLSSPVRQCRAVVLLPEETWVVIDELAGCQMHDYRLHWLLGDWPYAWRPDLRSLDLEIGSSIYRVKVLTTNTEVDQELVRASASGPSGWRAHTYHQMSPALSLTVSSRARSAYFITVLGAKWQQAVLDKNVLRISAQRTECSLLLTQANGKEWPIVQTIEVSDPTGSKLSARLEVA
ncbi:MAG: alginate lyase family protein [Caldilineaceae bacterium]